MPHSIFFFDMTIGHDMLIFYSIDQRTQPFFLLVSNFAPHYDQFWLFWDP